MNSSRIFLSSLVAGWTLDLVKLENRGTFAFLVKL